MTLRKLLKVVIGLFILFAIVIGLTSINHPIIIKRLVGSARYIGKPIQATVYTDGQINNDIKVFHTDKYWGSNEKANNYFSLASKQLHNVKFKGNRGLRQNAANILLNQSLSLRDAGLLKESEEAKSKAAKM